jgi:hypothetical protein
LEYCGSAKINCVGGGDGGALVEVDAIMMSHVQQRAVPGASGARARGHAEGQPSKQGRQFSVPFSSGAARGEYHQHHETCRATGR